ncbi:MAG: hypothetical protein Q9225_003900 [Loekoesia sp. 1 TL-2023]
MEEASLTLPITPILDVPPQELSPIKPLTTPPPFYIRKGPPKTITETVSITISEFYVSFATESSLLTLTDTVYINKTVFNYITLTHTNHLTHTVNNTLPPMTVFATTTLLPPTGTPTAALAQATLSAAPDHQGGSRLKPVAIAFIALGAVGLEGQGE